MNNAEHLLDKAWRARRDRHLDIAHADLDKLIAMSRSAGDDAVLARASS